MTTSERCPITELLPAECAHCRHLPDLDEHHVDRTALLAQGWVTARYPGTCRQCGEHFNTGAAISQANARGWVAECCAEDTK